MSGTPAMTGLGKDSHDSSSSALAVMVEGGGEGQVSANLHTYIYLPCLLLYSSSVDFEGNYWQWSLMPSYFITYTGSRNDQTILWINNNVVHSLLASILFMSSCPVTNHMVTLTCQNFE